MLVKNAAEAGDGAVNDMSVCRCLVKDDSITVLRTVGIGEFGVVQHAVWTKDTAQQVSCAASLTLSVSLSVCLSVCRSLVLPVSLCLSVVLPLSVCLSVCLSRVSCYLCLVCQSSSPCLVMSFNSGTGSLWKSVFLS